MLYCIIEYCIALCGVNELLLLLATSNLLYDVLVGGQEKLVEWLEPVCVSKRRKMTQARLKIASLLTHVPKSGDDELFFSNIATTATTFTELHKTVLFHRVVEEITVQYSTVQYST